MAGVLVISGILLFLFASCTGCAREWLRVLSSAEPQTIGEAVNGSWLGVNDSETTEVESLESRDESHESSVEGPREAIVPVVSKEESRVEGLETRDESQESSVKGPREAIVPVVGKEESRGESLESRDESSRAAEERIVLRGTQESTETVAKNTGDFSENDAFLKGQKLSSQSSTGAGATAEEVESPASSVQRQESRVEGPREAIVPIVGKEESRDEGQESRDESRESKVEAVPLSSDTEEPVVEKILPPVLTDERPGVEENVADNAPSQPLELSSQTSEHSSQTALTTDTTQTIQQPKLQKPYLALRTNLLYDAVVVPNIGLEVAVGAGFTIGADWFYTWIPLDKPHYYWQTYGGYLTLRYYVGRQAKENPYTGHHVGLYGSMLTYDVEFGGIGYQAAQFGFGGGVEYGYSLPVARSLCIDFNLGIGYQGGEYKKYMPTDDGTGHYVWMSTHRRHWFGPTKAEISLKWLIGPYEKKSSAAEEKGGGL